MQFAYLLKEKRNICLDDEWFLVDLAICQAQVAIHLGNNLFQFDRFLSKLKLTLILEPLENQFFLVCARTACLLHHLSIQRYTSMILGLIRGKAAWGSGCQISLGIDRQLVGNAIDYYSKPLNRQYDGQRKYPSILQSMQTQLLTHTS